MNNHSDLGLTNLVYIHGRWKRILSMCKFSKIANYHYTVLQNLKKIAMNSIKYEG